MMRVAGRRSVRRVGAWLALAMCAASGCRSSGGEDPCPDQQPPSFLVTVTAADGILPVDTRVRLAYGGGQEEYLLNGTDNHPSVLFCRAENKEPALGGGTAGSAGANSRGSPKLPSKLICEIWIEGAATIWIQGGDYAELELELSADANECGPETVDEQIELRHDQPEDDR